MPKNAEKLTQKCRKMPKKMPKNAEKKLYKSNYIKQKNTMVKYICLKCGKEFKKKSVKKRQEIKKATYLQKLKSTDSH